ncbi:hypothetical protein LCGC14_1066040 [marine sediment metagenome]|uniref:PD-(D/E)XK endonuclease-like domain-containing protein n=1 Tax=marine sediment metagenome TaxID=412755 RepID=A0A0F9Q2P2_9ZZZZ
MLLYDPVSKKLYIADYKPDLDFEDFGNHNAHDSFINSIPQIAAYALLFKEKFGIEVEGLIFNSEGAWTFKPNVVLNPINTFMLGIYPTWIPPWQPLMKYSV